ncbi:lipoyl(octanoyl) transferase [Neorickettsia helminthoeca str. Oregon]|uniref:Octanoyltransferase n=1 Tax=Neorickettsia helminthoeca str. Oregon TaxID=1286528 RepID=X5HJ33_9RICK|nr:lipoyl(octanoyl) transferase LipB [Neorickettsia helminthoeca]AHX11064.1 lipoyl(octanoyl) transferase [Neorickettsia helminthoeca str. Oregon]
MEWRIDTGFVDYQESLKLMQERVTQIIFGTGDELIWMLQYQSLYTGGSSADTSELLNQSTFPVFHVGRGGRYTYHGPGQRVVYLMLDLKKRDLCDLRRYISLLEEVVIRALSKFGVMGIRKEKYIGVWVETKDGLQKKIAAIGVRISKWVSYHGIAINLYPSLEHYCGIVPCGVKEFGVTSLKEMGIGVSDFGDFDRYFQEAFQSVFVEI